MLFTVTEVLVCSLDDERVCCFVLNDTMLPYSRHHQSITHSYWYFKSFYHVHADIFVTIKRNCYHFMYFILLLA